MVVTLMKALPSEVVTSGAGNTRIIKIGLKSSNKLSKTYARVWMGFSVICPIF